MKKILALTFIIGFSTICCNAQNDTVIYYGPNGAISTESNAIEYIRVESGKKKKKAQNYRLWTYNKYNGKWNEPDSYEELRQENDSTYWIHTIRSKKTSYQIKRTIQKKEDGSYHIRNYSATGTLLSEGKSKTIFPLYKIGQHKTYYSNGNVSRISEFSDNQELGNQNWNKNGDMTLGNIFSTIDQMPIFKEGESDLLNYLAKNVKYPNFAKETGIQGTVYVSFVVKKNGKVVDVTVIKGIGGGCDKESIRVISKMPKWTPGKLNGNPVHVVFNLPIRFVLL